MEEQLELEFQKFNLKEGDVLVIKTNLQGLTEEEAVSRLSELREDEFVKYIEGKGNKVVVSYTGVDFQILRTEPTDKVVVYVDSSTMSEEESTEYLDLIKSKLSGTIANDIVMVPLTKGSVGLKIEKGENNE